MADYLATGRAEGLKVIGAGFGRTGTLSLKAALEELGFGPCYHMTELFNHSEDITQWEDAMRGEAVDWRALFEGYQATVDWPGCTFYAELMHTYPDARVLLTTREPDSWYESVTSTIYQISNIMNRFPFASLLFSLMRRLYPGRVRVIQLIRSLIWEGTFSGRFDDKQHAIAVFAQHNEEVKRRVPPDKLLVFNVKEGWEPLCRFLGVPVPVDKPFPHLNDRFNFAGNRIWEQQRRRVRNGLIALGMVGVTVLLLRYVTKLWGLTK